MTNPSSRAQGSEGRASWREQRRKSDKSWDSILAAEARISPCSSMISISNWVIIIGARIFVASLLILLNKPGEYFPGHPRHDEWLLVGSDIQM
jgi:hypothetical protein